MVEPPKNFSSPSSLDDMQSAFEMRNADIDPEKFADICVELLKLVRKQKNATGEKKPGSTGGGS